MNLYLMRHGTAHDLGADAAESDAQRPLTDNGRRNTRLAAKALRKLDITFEIVLASPLVRADQTARILCLDLGIPKKIQPCPALIPPGHVRDLVQLVRELSPAPENLLLVGHEPSLSELAALWIFGDRSAGITLKKGALCKLVVENFRAGKCGVLQWLMTAKQLRAIAA